MLDKNTDKEIETLFQEWVVAKVNRELKQCSNDLKKEINNVSEISESIDKNVKGVTNSIKSSIQHETGAINGKIEEESRNLSDAIEEKSAGINNQFARVAGFLKQQQTDINKMKELLENEQISAQVTGLENAIASQKQELTSTTIAKSELILTEMENMKETERSNETALSILKENQDAMQVSLMKHQKLLYFLTCSNVISILGIILLLMGI